MMEKALDTELKQTRTRLDDYLEYGSGGLPAAHEAVLFHELSAASRVYPFTRTTRRNPIDNLIFSADIKVDMKCSKPLAVIPEEMRQKTRSFGFNALDCTVEQLMYYWFIMFQVRIHGVCCPAGLVVDV